MLSCPGEAGGPALGCWSIPVDHAVIAQRCKYLWLSLFLDPGSGASMAAPDPASGCPHGKKQLPGQCVMSVFWGFSFF